MLNSDKLDSFFESNQPLEFEKFETGKREVDWRRIFKIFLPCLAACLLGLMVIMPNIKKSVNLQDNITVPRKNEMEQLHIEQTVFNIVDNKNRVNKIVADSVDEVKSGSQRYKIVHPKATLPTDNGQTVITSQDGYFNQNNNVLDLVKDVKVVTDDGTVITTSKASYDFDNEKGWGRQEVFAEGNWGNMQAKAFVYSRLRQILVLKGNNHIKSKRGELTADEQTRIYQTKNMTISTGNARVFQGANKLFADKIIGWFSKSSKKELERAEAYKNVRMETPSETITGGEAYYDALNGKIEVYGDSRAQQGNNPVIIKQKGNTLRASEVTVYVSRDGRNDLQKAIAVGKVAVKTADGEISGDKGIYTPRNGKIEIYGFKHPVEIVKEDKVLHAKQVNAYLDKNKELKYAQAFGEVEVITPKGSAWGDRGVYNPQENKVELFDNVRLEQNGNFITGAYAVTDMETSVSRITGDENTDGRIRGTFYRKRK